MTTQLFASVKPNLFDEPDPFVRIGNFHWTIWSTLVDGLVVSIEKDLSAISASPFPIWEYLPPISSSCLVLTHVSLSVAPKLQSLRHQLVMLRLIISNLPVSFPQVSQPGRVERAKSSHRLCEGNMRSSIS